MRYEQICKMLAAKNCKDSGMTVKQIAQQAKVSTSTVRRWLKNFSN